MNSLNKVQLIGNLTAEPQAKQTPNGQYVANFSIATNRQWKDNNGEKQEQTEFHNVVVWGKLAEIANQYLVKGNKVFLEGRLQTRSWEDEVGQKKYKTEIVGENLIMLSPKSQTQSVEEDMPEFEEPKANPAPKKKQTPKQDDFDIEDIPF